MSVRTSEMRVVHLSEDEIPGDLRRFGAIQIHYVKCISSWGRRFWTFEKATTKTGYSLPYGLVLTALAVKHSQI